VVLYSPAVLVLVGTAGTWVAIAEVVTSLLAAGA
jgi:hypothetical protein